MEEDTTEDFVDASSGKSNAEVTREFWRAHKVTMGEKDWTRDDLYDRIAGRTTDSLDDGTGRQVSRIACGTSHRLVSA